MSIKFINGTQKKDNTRRLEMIHENLKNMRVNLDELDAPDEIKDSIDHLIMYYDPK